MMNETGIQPIEYKVLVEVKKDPEMTDSGLFLPESARDRSEVARGVGTLVAIGGLAFNRNDHSLPQWPETPQPGDVVFFDKYAGTVIRSNGKTYRLINDKQVAAIITTKIDE